LLVLTWRCRSARSKGIIGLVAHSRRVGSGERIFLPDSALCDVDHPALASFQHWGRTQTQGANVSKVQSSAGPAAGSDTGQQHPTPHGWRHSKELIVAELALFAAIFIADWQGLIWGSKTPLLFALGWISLYVRGMGWKDLGWGRYRTWMRTLVVGITA